MQIPDDCLREFTSNGERGTCVFSLAVTLWSAADWRLTEAEKPSLSAKFQELLVSMTDDTPNARTCLYDVLQTCESLQTEDDMTSGERCQALLWEYQASAAMDSDDTSKRKTVQGEKKHHDTLMASISVATSFKGFLKQTAKPQERNPLIKTQNKGESFRNLDGANSKEEKNKTSPKPEEMKAEKANEATTSNSLNSEKDRLASNALNDRSSDTIDVISNQDPRRDPKRDHSLTEDEKQQLLSLLASTKLNKGPFYAVENYTKSDKISKPVEDQLPKPPSPSLFAYPHYGQTESQMIFNPIILAGRSSSPSVNSDVGENQIPSVPTPTFVPIAVPIPSVAPVPMPPYWYMSQGGMMSYPHPAMSPVPFVPVDPSVTSNQSVVSIDSDVSNLSDANPRPKSKNSAIPKPDKSEGLREDTQRSNKGSKQNREENKGSKLPRPIWQRPIPKYRTTSEESESNVKVVRRGVPFNDEFNESSEGMKQIHARTPSPSLGRRAAPQKVNPPRSLTPPLYWTKDGMNMSPRNKRRARASTGSLPNRPSNPSGSPNKRRRSSSFTLGSTTNSPVQGRKNQGSGPSSPAGSRSNSPVSILVSKFDQLSQESADSSPRVRSDSETSMISRFGSSSLAPEDRLTKGQFKPNISAISTQPASKTGSFRPSSVRNKAHCASDLETSMLRPHNSISSKKRGSAGENPIDESSTYHPGDPREVQRSGSDPGSTDGRERRISTSHCALHQDKESTSEKFHDSRTRLLENIRKWTSQENIMRDCSSSGALVSNTQERLVSGLSLFGDYCTKRDQGNQKGNPKARLQGSSSGQSKSSTYSGRSPASNDLRNDYIIKSSNISDNLSKPWKGKDSSSNRISTKSSLDSEPVGEKGSPRFRPRDLCLSPERDSTIPFCDVRSPSDLLRSPKSDTRNFEIPVDLAILDATTPVVSSSVGGPDWTHGGVDGNIISPPFPLSPGSLKDVKSNHFNSATFKCGEMEPERDTNCIINKPSRDNTDYVSSDCDSNRRGPTGNYVRRLERRILRSTGDLETEVFASNSTSVQKSCYPTKNPSSKTEINDNPRPKLKNSPPPSKPESSSTISHVNGNPQTPRMSSKVDQVARSRHPFGECPPRKDIATVSKNPSSPMTLRKIMSNPLSQDAGTSQGRISVSKRNSLPTLQPINPPSCHDRSGPTETHPITKSSSHTNLSQKQQRVFKSPSQNNLSVRKSSGDLSRISPKEGNLGKSSPYSKSTSSNTPSPNGEDSKSRGSSTTGNPGYPSPSKERHNAKGQSSNPPVKGGRSFSSTSTTTDPSESDPVRYPYTRRGSMPAGGCSTIKPSPKAASNPILPLHAKPPKAKIEFFGATGEDNTHSAIHPRGSNGKDENLTKTHQNPTPISQSDFESSVDSSKAPSQCAKSSSKSGFPSRELASEQNSNSMGKTEESEVFYIARSDETLLKSDIISSNRSKRFPSNSSSDSGFNLSDTDESRGSIGKAEKSHRARSPPLSPTTLSPTHSRSPTSSKFPIGKKFFLYPNDHKPPPSEEGPLSVSKNDPTTLAFLCNSVKRENSSNPIQASEGKSKESPKKTTQSDGDKFKHPKVDTSKIMDKSSLNSDEKANVDPEKLKEGSASSKLTTKGKMGRSTSKEFVAASTPSPDILERPASKSPPSSSRVDSKELLGQLVKKVLNSAAAKQGSSPKTAFAESENLVAKTSGKGMTVALTNEMTEAKREEKISSQGKILTANSSTHKSGLFDAEKTPKMKEIGLMSETSLTQNRDKITPEGTLRSQFGTLSDTPISSTNASIPEGSSREETSLPGAKVVLCTIIDMIQDEFAFDGYLDDGVEDVNMAEYVLSLAGMSEENFKEAITDQYSDLYWDEDLLHEMYEAVTEGQQTRRSTLQYSESGVSDISPPESISLSREESYLSLEPLYFNSIPRSSSERSGTRARDILMSPLGEATEFLPIKVIAPEMQADIQELLTPVFEEYYKVMGVKLVSSVEGLAEKLGTKIGEISQQLMLERKAKKKSMNSYSKMAEVENKKDVKDLASKLVNEIEECDKKIIYLKNVQRRLRNVYAERFGLDTSLLYSFLVSYNTSCVTLVPELNNNFLNFSPIWNQRGNESVVIADESLNGPSLQSGTKLGLFSYLFDRHAMSQAYVRYFLYTFRYIATAQELFNFIREKCSTSLRTDSSGQVYNHQLQIRYRGLDLLSEWIDSFYQFDFKTNPNVIKELLAFVKDELILVDRSERGHYLMELIAEKQKRDMNNNLSSDEPSDFVAVLQLEDPQGLSPVDVLRKPLGGRKAKSSVQCFRKTTPHKDTSYKATPYLKALSIVDHSSRVIAEQLTLIQQDLFFHIHPVHFLNSRAHGIGVGRSQSPTKERDNMFGFSTGSRRVSEVSSLGEGPVSREQNMYVSEPSTDGLLEDLLEHAHDVSLWVAVEICSASSIKAQLALITKFVNAARYCCEIRNYSTCFQIVDALEMFVIRQLPAWRQVPTKTTETLEELKAVKVLLKTDSSWLMKSEASREKPTIPCFLLFVIHVQQQELGGFTLPNDMFKWTKMRSTARLVDQIRLFKQMRYAFQTDDEVKERLKQRIQECKSENLHALASENASNFHLSSSQGSRKFHDAFRKMKATLGGHN